MRFCVVFRSAIMRVPHFTLIHCQKQNRFFNPSTSIAQLPDPQETTLSGAKPQQVIPLLTKWVSWGCMTSEVFKLIANNNGMSASIKTVVSLIWKTVTSRALYIPLSSPSRARSSKITEINYVFHLPREITKNFRGRNATPLYSHSIFSSLSIWVCSGTSPNRYSSTAEIFSSDYCSLGSINGGTLPTRLHFISDYKLHLNKTSTTIYKGTQNSNLLSHPSIVSPWSPFTNIHLSGSPRYAIQISWVPARCRPYAWNSRYFVHPSNGHGSRLTITRCVPEVLCTT